MATLYVRKNGSGTHTEIQSAIYDAAVGDVIDIEAGTFNENVDLYKGVTLQGAGQEATIIQGAQETSVVRSFTCALGSTTLTMTSGTAGLKKGRLISGTAIPANTRIVSVGATSVTISAATTAARSSATNATMAAITDGTLRVRGSGASLRDLKVIGFDGSSAANELSAIFLRNVGAGSAAASNVLIENVHAVASGEYALLSDSTASISNITVQNCKFSGKTFVGSNPGIGNQFSVPNVPRQLVVLQSQNTGTVVFSNNLIEGTSGGLTVDGQQSFNTAVTVDAVGALIENNRVRGANGYGYGIRARGANAVVRNNVVYNYGAYSANGYFISGTGAVDQNNSIVSQALVAPMQPVAGQPVSVGMSKPLVKDISKVSSSASFSDDSTWTLVTFVFKKQGSSKRLVSSFKNFEQSKSMKLRSGMMSGDTFELHKIIISKADRSLLVVKRSEIAEVSSFDFILA